VCAGADHVHEEYREFTEKPIQKIMAPITKSALFKPSRAKQVVSLANGSGTELMPLTGGDAPDGSSHLLASPAHAAAKRSGAGDASTSALRSSDTGLFPAAAVSEHGPASGAALDGMRVASPAPGGAPSPAVSPGAQAAAGLQGEASHAAVARSTSLGLLANGKGGVQRPPRKLQQHVD
jgi:hypothetical protein